MIHYKDQTEGLIELVSPPKQDLDVFWSSSLQHMTVSGGQVTLANCLVTCRACCHLTVRDEWENTGCSYSVWCEFSFLGGWFPSALLGRSRSHVIRPGMQQRAIQLCSNGMLWHHRPADCFPTVKGLTIFGVVGMNWLWYRERILKKTKKTSLMPKLCVSVSVFQHSLLEHGRCYYIMAHVFPVTFSTDSPLLSLQNILNPTSTGPPTPLILITTDQKLICTCMHCLWNDDLLLLLFSLETKGFPNLQLQSIITFSLDS